MPIVLAVEVDSGLNWRSVGNVLSNKEMPPSKEVF
jgi:hypothetical protein